MEIITKKKYEGLFLLNLSRLGSDQAKGVKIVRDLLEKHGATVAEADVWDERKLAFPVEKQKRGLYVVAHFESDPQALTAIVGDMNISEDVLRHLFQALGDAFPEFPRRRRRSEEESAGGGRDRDRDRDGGRDRDRDREGSRRSEFARPAARDEDEDVDTNEDD